MPKTKQKTKKVIKKSVTLKASDEFVVGKYTIGYLDSDFRNAFYTKEFTPNTLGTFQKLGSYMENADAIESKLNPGKCTLGDVYAFLQNPPQGCDDGWSNLFLIGDKVVSVVWYSDSGVWLVSTWSRDESWSDDRRVFSPGLGTQTLESSESLTLESAIKIVKKAGYLIYQQV